MSGNGFRVRKMALRGLVYLLLTLLAIVTLVPILFAFFGSFKTLNELVMGGQTLLPESWRWQNYRDAWQSANFSAYVKNTLYVAAGVVVIDLFGTSMLGYVLARKKQAVFKLIEILLAATIFLGLGTITLYPKTVIAIQLGALNLNGVVLVLLSSVAAVHTFLVRSFCQSIPGELYDAAVIDGAGFFGTYRRIALPLMAPILATTAILSFKLAWNGFQVPFVFTLADPDLRTLPVGLFLLKDGTGSGVDQWNLLMAGTVMSLVPIISLFVFFQKAFVRNLGGGALK